jgi:hypothetical protein
MAAEATVGSMEGQGNAAVLALLDMSAFGTEHGCVETSPIEEENTLFAGGATLSQCFHEWS